MFAKLIEIALKSALENSEIKEKIKNLKINLMEQENKKNKIIDLEIEDYTVLK